ncbi:Succinate dehydrogenase [ubiquinone] cytochrome b small subunit [Saitozyma sp. JCM 24511]|nr:Succinate dehydrogenase [ubiquinone] cytochrome b small subunit [Saitozyma sp. JCM 24511]
MSVVRSTLPTLRGLGVRPIHTSRALALHASRTTRDATISANETGGFKYVPGGPVLKGTVNDATTFPPPSKSHGSYHWTFERLLSASLIPVMGSAAVSTGSAYPILDGILAVSLIAHSHLGLATCIDDYVHPRKNPVLGPLAMWALRIGTGLSVWGVYEFNTNDIGLTELVRRMWKA